MAQLDTKVVPSFRKKKRNFQKIKHSNAKQRNFENPKTHSENQY